MPNGASPMCNRVYRARPDEIVVAEAHLPSPMEVEHRPREAQLAGDSIIATRSTLCHGGFGGRHSCRLTLAAPNPLWYFLRGESTIKQAPQPCQGQNKKDSFSIISILNLYYFDVYMFLLNVNSRACIQDFLLSYLLDFFTL